MGIFAHQLFAELPWQAKSVLWISDFSRNIVVAVIFCLVVGCGPKSDRLGVSGEVTFDGVPLENGSIQFTAVGTDRVASTGAMIQDGKYAIPQAKGLLPGTYQIVISAADENGPMVTIKDASGKPLTKAPAELLPPEYNVDSDKTVEVTVEGENHFVFEIVK